MGYHGDARCIKDDQIKHLIIKLSTIHSFLYRSEERASMRQTLCQASLLARLPMVEMGESLIRHLIARQKLSSTAMYVILYLMTRNS